MLPGRVSSRQSLSQSLLGNVSVMSWSACGGLLGDKLVTTTPRKCFDGILVICVVCRVMSSGLQWHERQLLRPPRKPRRRSLWQLLSAKGTACPTAQLPRSHRLGIDHSLKPAFPTALALTVLVTNDSWLSTMTLNILISCQSL